MTRILLLAFALAGCATHSKPPLERVVFRAPLADTVLPVPPASLGARPSRDARTVADLLLAQLCRVYSYVLVADPLLTLSAGKSPRQLPDYPECEEPTK